MDLHFLDQADRVLTKCGYRPATRGGVVVPLEKKLLLPMVLEPNQSLVFTKVIPSETVFALRAISSDLGMTTYTGVRLQIQFPNGRYLFGGNGIDAGQFAWVGSYRRLMDPEVDCEPDSKLSVSLTDVNTGGLAQPLALNLVFEGAEKFYFQGGRLQPFRTAAEIPRYQGIVNENIMAPAWVMGLGPRLPAGYKSESRFTYSSAQLTVPLAGPVSAATRISINNGYDFACRRILFDVTGDATVTAGSFLVRVRTGDGYALCDDYIDFPRYLAGASFPCGLRIRGGDEVFIEVGLVDAVGTGNMYITAHLEGAERIGV